MPPVDSTPLAAAKPAAGPSAASKLPDSTPALTHLHKKTAQAIVNIFETGSARGAYGSVTLLPNDTGHLTYGRSQTTLASGNLHLLIKSYCEAPEAQLASELNPFLPRLAACDTSLDRDATLRSLLHEAGGDAVMRDVQDRFFDRVYWAPTLGDATHAGVRTPLGTSVVYDSHIQGAWRLIRERTTARRGEALKIGEKTWISGYVNERRNWLASHPNRLLHQTVYRMDSFLELIASAKWDLPLPLKVHGVYIDQDVLSPAPTSRPSAHTPDERTLSLQTPALHGDEVGALQRALADAEVTVAIDKVFGPATAAAVKQFQRRRGLVTDGIAGPATRSALGL